MWKTRFQKAGHYAKLDSINIEVGHNPKTDYIYINSYIWSIWFKNKNLIFWRSSGDEASSGRR